MDACSFTCMTIKRLHEAGTLAPDASGTKFRVCLISEGMGSSALFPRAFFNSQNAAALAGALSFPGHPEHSWAPEHRDPLSAIGMISDTVTIEEVDGRIGFWSEYSVAKSRPDVSTYLVEFGSKLGLSIFIESDGQIDDMTGVWVATDLNAEDPYRSVDLVVAAGARGKFDRAMEALLRITEASATAGGKEGTRMDKDIADEFSKVTKLVEGLAAMLEGKAKADLQIEADTSAVTRAVESRLTEYDKAVDLITGAKLTESQSASLRALAKNGADIAPHIESAKQVLAEAKALAGIGSEPEHDRLAENHLGAKDNEEWAVDVRGFGKVKVS